MGASSSRPTRIKPRRLPLPPPPSPSSAASSSNINHQAATADDQRISQVIQALQLLATDANNAREANKLQHAMMSNKIHPTSSQDEEKIVGDDDECTICLEAYDRENPKTIARCMHYYHLSCMLEWMERSPKCPICDEVFIIDDSNK